MEPSCNEAEGDGGVNNRKSLVVSRRELFEYLNSTEASSTATRVVGKLAPSARISDGEDDTDSRRSVNSTNNRVNNSDNSVNDNCIDVNANQPQDRCETTAAQNHSDEDLIEDEDQFRNDFVPELKLPAVLDSPASKRISYNIAVSKGQFGKFPVALRDELSSKINAINEKRGELKDAQCSPDDSDDSSDCIRVSDVNTDHASTNDSAAVVDDVREINIEDLSKAKLTENKLSVISSSRITDNRETPVAAHNCPSEKPKDQDYPEELNPFGDDDEHIEVETPETSTSPVNPFDSDDESGDKPDEKSVENVKINTNPFWSGSEDEEDAPSLDSVSMKKTPIPLPRTVKKPIPATPQPSPTTRVSGDDVSHDQRTRTAITTIGVSPSPAPSRRSLQTSCRKLSSDSLDVSFQRSPASQSVNSTLRKKKPAPPPPPVAANNARDNNQNASNEQITKTDTALPVPEQSVRKVSTSPWKNKKGPAPARPIPLRRPVKEMPIEDIKTELSDIEIRQQELDRQGKQLEQMIRDRTNTDDEPKDSSSPSEELVLQLFELVNEKNELLRRHSELMYMRKMHNLEEEHAEIEYQLRCLMLRPESNKTDSDKTTEEELLRRLLEVVEKRNEIIEAMDKDRQREKAEDKSVTTQLDEKKCGTKDDKVGKKQKKSKKDKIKEHKEEDGDKHESKHSPSKAIKQKFMTLRHSAKKLNSKLPH